MKANHSEMRRLNTEEELTERSYDVIGWNVKKKTRLQCVDGRKVSTIEKKTYSID